MIEEAGGADTEVARIGGLAEYFRKAITQSDLPFEFVADPMSNAVTALTPTNGTSANDIINMLKDEYVIWICPNGGDLKDKVLRVEHIGALTTADYDSLMNAFLDLRTRGIL